jgi:hypothetical protein
MENNSLAQKIISLEKAALDRWGKGDPSGFIEISADDVCYFDPFLESRIDGKQALIDLYETLRGKIFIDSYEMINPHVQINDNTAVLTFNYKSQSGESINKWNCTEVYQRSSEDWQIIQSHWSITKAAK